MYQPSRFNTPDLLNGFPKYDGQVWEAFYEQLWEPLCRFMQAKLPNSTGGYGVGGCDRAFALVHEPSGGIYRREGPRGADFDR